MTPSILLFDVDGTLLLADGGGRRAMELAFDEVHRRPDAVRDVDLRGMTDLRIFREALVSIGAAADPEAVAAVTSAYLRHLAWTVPAAAGFTVLPGVAALLDSLVTESHLAVGLGTGNLELGARIKLERADLSRYFAFGGYGSDHEDRAEVLRIGAARGAACLSVPLSDCRVVVVGDTPRDLAAAQAIGASAVIVATGGHSMTELAAAGATMLFENLADARARRAILDGGTPR